MRRARQACTAIVLLLLLHFVHAPLQAQKYKWDATVNGGWSTWTHALSADSIGFDDVSGFSLGNSAIGGAQVGYWFTSYLGARLNFAYAESTLEQGFMTLFNTINQWSGTGDVLVRFVKPHSRWSGRELLPFLALGVGAQWINPAGDQFAMTNHVLTATDGATAIINGQSGIPVVCQGGICRGPATPGFPGIGTLGSFGERTFFLKETSTFSGLVSLGVDARVARHFAFRLEAGDRMWQAPIAEIVRAELSPTLIVLDNSVGETVHHLFITGGLSFLFGLRPPPPAVAALPAPPPPRAAAPPAPPTTESIKVCVIDPTITNGVRTIAATRDLRTGDTTVVRQGHRLPLAALTAKVIVAGNAHWYLTGAPFEIGTGEQRLVFLPTGSGHAVDGAELSFIGTVAGLPIYIARAELSKPLENLGPNTDLVRTLAQSADVRTALENVHEILVPLSASGCVFQSMALQMQVRKGK